jgi:geranylgeranylglycerol-phosphate geranylgeranyltransferase
VSKIVPILKLIRIHNCLLAGVGVWMGWYLAGDAIFTTRIYLSSIAAALVCGAGNAVNDFLDINIDLINHPSRPLPAGELPSYSAVLIGIVFNLAAIILAFFVNWRVFLVVIFAVLLLFLYNTILKRLPLWGNISVSLLGGLTFITGALVFNDNRLFYLPGPAVPAVFAFLFHFGRELVKDLEDFHGDNQADFRTLPTIIPRWSVHLIISILFIALIILTAFPVFYNWYGLIFNYIVVFLVDLPLLILILYLFISGRPGRYKVTSELLKVLMLVGLIAFYLGKNGRL